MLEPQASEVEAVNGTGNASPVQRRTPVVHRRQLNPPVIRLEPGAPHDGAGLDDSVATDRQPAALIDDAADANDPRRMDRAFRNADALIPMFRPRAHALAEGGFHRRPLHDGPHPVEEITPEEPAG